MATPLGDPDTRAALLLAEMTLQEKEVMLHGDCMSCPYVGHIPGNHRLGIPPLNMHDGPQGFRTTLGFPARGTSTSWPGSMALAATWDTQAVYDWGAAMGKEFKRKGSNVQLGPGLNLARVPLNGRNFEYISGEDPYLGYKLSSPVVRGIQDQHVIACAKHWVVNSQETNRMFGTEDVDERTLFEMYYPPFEGAIDADVGSVMCSYQKVNGIYSCENPTTLGGHLKKALDFKGFVVSDWGATHSASLPQGLDMEMPIGVLTNAAGLYVSRVFEADINNAVQRILRTMFAIGVFDEPHTTWDSSKFGENVTTAESVKLARRLGVQSTVLLKNAGGVLPLPQGRKLALIGFASENGKALSFGHGSGEVEPSHYISPLVGIRAVAGAGAEVYYDDGSDLERAVAVAKEADYAIVFVGASASEGDDRKSLSLDGLCTTFVFGLLISCQGNDANQNSMVETIANVNPRTIVVASVPGAVLMPWSGQVPAVIVNFMPGQEVGNALADVLFGIENPSARLPITMPNTANDLGMTPGQWPGELDTNGIPHSTYSEKLLVGYRYYDAHNISFTLGFPFGHGLSYTSFRYSDLVVDSRTVIFRVANVGLVPGQEIAQLYLAFPSSAGEAPLQLKGFRKTALLTPGEAETVRLPLRARDLSIWDVSTHKWALVKGTFKLRVGASSRDIRLSGQLDS